MIYFGTIAYVEMKFMGDILLKQILFAGIMGEMASNGSKPHINLSKKQAEGKATLWIHY